MLDTILALSAMFLGLSLAVQVIQELWKFLTSTKASTYRMVLKDSLGPWVDQLYEAGPASGFQVRRPFQFFRSNPEGVLLPMKKEELLEAMDTVASDWLGYGLETLKREVRLQRDGAAPPSPHFRRALGKIATAGEGREPESRNARQVQRFLTTWLNEEARARKEPDDGEASEAADLDARRLLEGFYLEFFPDRLKVDREFGQIQHNFDHVYHRRNLLLSFVFGLLLAIVLCFPFDALYRQAATLSPQEAQALAATMIEYSEVRDGPRSEARGQGATDSEPSQEAGATPNGEADGADGADAELRDRFEASRQQIDKLLTTVAGDQAGIYEPTLSHLPELLHHPTGIPWYLFNCLITALLISFGAPFWHRLSSALLRIRQDGGGGGDETGSGTAKTASGKGA